MRIDLDDAKRGPVPWSETTNFDAASSGAEELAAAGIASLGPVANQGELKHAEPHFRLTGRLSYQQRLSCYRCLVEFADEVDDDFEYVLDRSRIRNEAEDSDVEANGDASDSGSDEFAGGEVELASADLEALTVHSDHIETTDYIREQVLLHVPMKPLCNADCKGLCSVCGTDLNSESCDCVAEPNDPRWAGLKALKDQLQS